MTSILFIVETIYRNQFRCNYIRNKNFLQMIIGIFEI